MTKNEFKDYLNSFLRISGMTATTFSLKAMGDPSFVSKVRNGRECREITQQRAENFIRKYVFDHGMPFDWKGI